MNPVFFIILFVAAALLWLLLSFLYKPLGWIGKRLIDDAKKAMTEKKSKEDEKGEE